MLAGAAAGVMFGASDVVEGVGDLTSGITCQGLDQRSYNPVRDTVFGGNEFLYTGAEVAVSLGTSAAANKALAASAVKEATTAASEAETVSSGAKVAEEAGAVRCIGAKPYSGIRKPELDFAGKSGVGGERLLDHLDRHGKDFGFTTEEEYLQGARRFFEKPLTPTTEAFTSNQGWYFRYDTATNEFGLINNYGGISTYYKPDIPNYWSKQIQDYAPK